MGWSIAVFVGVIVCLVRLGSGQCPPINPIPDSDSWYTSRIPSSGFGGIETQTDGGHKDIFLSSPQKLTKIGSRLDWGGSVIFFGLSANPESNVIDAHDTGRELQIALYDPARISQPCACNATCQTDPYRCPGNGIPFLGWDPVQGGDKCGNGSPINSAGQFGNDTLQVTVSPLQWNPDWDVCSCAQRACSNIQPVPSGVEYVMGFRYLSENTIGVSLQINNLANLSHEHTNQEFPTIYVSYGDGGPDLPILLSGNGSQLTIPVGSDGWGVLSFESPVPYISYQNEAQNYGLGFLMDQGLREFQAWTGKLPLAPYFHNFRTLIDFPIPALSTIRGMSYFCLGNFDTIQGQFEHFMSIRPPFGSLDVPPAPYTTTYHYSPGQNVSLAGWALDNRAGVTIKVSVDGNAVATFPLVVQRSDVCLMYPQYVNCPVVGYEGEIGTTGLSTSCSHLLRVEAVDSDGNISHLGDRIFAFN